ncbi:MAG: hypothetical protein A3H39_19530 [candidate division NC10 bacterium RIFCSPLOWO2_02_FULL_66_22]|nr:MAG: hypothetical protein A3H39_19530 [candidate division NC10 bacterium RIFCSPLOWO2_02_FULL_66_22]
MVGKWVALFLGGLTVASLSIAEAASPVVVRYAIALNATDPSTRAMAVFKEEAEKRSGGRLRVDVFHSGQLGGTGELMSQVKGGTLNMALAAPAFVQALAPKLAVITFPYLFNDAGKAFAILDGPIGKELEAEVEKAGIKILSWHASGFRHVLNNRRAIQTPADMRGIKLRLQPNPVHLATFRAFGANPLAMDFKELYSATQQGVIDGMELPITTIHSSKFYEVTKYLSMTGHAFEVLISYANKAWFDGLPKELQGTLLEAGREEARWQRREHAAEEDKMLAELRQRMTVNTPTEAETAQFRQIAQGVYKEFEKAVTPELLQKIQAAAR